VKREMDKGVREERVGFMINRIGRGENKKKQIFRWGRTIKWK